MAPEFGMGGFPARAKRPVIVCILAKKYLLDEKAGGFLQKGLRMACDGGRFSQGLPLTGGNLQQKSYPLWQREATRFAGQPRVAPHTKSGSERFWALHLNSSLAWLVASIRRTQRSTHRNKDHANSHRRNHIRSHSHTCSPRIWDQTW